MDEADHFYTGRIVADPAVLVGKPVIKGTRIAVEHVIEQRTDEPDFNQLFEVCPDLTMDDVRAPGLRLALTRGETVCPASETMRDSDCHAHLP
jgi:uncharacterized protein (DUF433 family)